MGGHTPGPWQRIGWTPPGIYSSGGMNEAVRIAGIDRRAEPQEAEVNARLIAAAPDLLEALQVVHKWFEITGSSVNARWERVPPEDRVAFVKAMKAAIAKATGGQP